MFGNANMTTAMALKIAVLEDDSALVGNVLIPGLTSLGFDVEGFLAAKDFYRRMLTQTFDAVVLDIVLPDEDGRHIARYLHTHHPNIAIIALTGLRLPHTHSTKSQVDVWLTKPVDIELLAVVLSDLSKRKQASGLANETPNRWRFDLTDWKLYSPDSKGLALSLRERVIVEHLLAAAGKAVPREELVATLHENGYDLDSQGLDVLIHRLRRKVLQTIGQPLPLHAARGKGYIMFASSNPAPEDGSRAD